MFLFRGTKLQIIIKPYNNNSFFLARYELIIAISVRLPASSIEGKT